MKYHFVRVNCEYNDRCNWYGIHIKQSENKPYNFILLKSDTEIFSDKPKHYITTGARERTFYEIDNEEILVTLEKIMVFE